MSDLSKDDITLTHDQLTRFCDLIRDEAGLALDQSKHRNRLRQKIKRRMAENEIEDPEEYYDEVWVSSRSNREMRSLINACVVNETLFYRNETQMQLLENEVFPALLSERRSSDRGPIKILSAGCSNGAEPYSAVIAFMEACRKNGYRVGDPGVKVIGADINTQALSEAKEGLYNRRPVENAPDRVVDRYFEKEGTKYRVKDTVRNHVTFRYLNLVDSTPPRKQDVVFHRNVLIYFEPDIREQVIEKLHGSLKDRGYLFVGHSEDFRPFRDYFEESSWKHRQIYRKWTTDRRVPSKSNNGQDSFKTGLGSGSNEKNSEIETSRINGEDSQRIVLKGVFDESIPKRELRQRVDSRVSPNASKLILDLTELDYVANSRLRVFKQVLAPDLTEDRELIVVTDDSKIEQWVENSMKAKRVTTRKEYETEGYDVKKQSGEETTETVGAGSVSPSENETESTIDQYLEETEGGQSPTDHFQLERQDDSLSLVLRGKLDSSEEPKLSRLLKEEITGCIDLIDRKGLDALEVDLNDVDYIDRKLVKILKRLSGLDEDEVYDIKLFASDDRVQRTLSRWGCEVH